MPDYFASPLPNIIISAAELLGRHQNGEEFALIDVREIAQWQTATLPGAHHLNVYDYFIPDSTQAGVNSLLNAFQRAWQALNISDNVTVVFFEQQVGMRSPRGAWFALCGGIRQPLVLDGGLDAWQRAGGDVMQGTGNSAVIRAENPDYRVPDSEEIAPLNALTATRAQVLAAGTTGAQILDARRPSEFSGEFAHECCHRAGRIPGANLLFWEDVVDNGAFLDAGEIRHRADKAGLQPDRQVIIYCHRGARAATVFTALQLAGYPQLAIYVGSWHEWAEHSELPLLTGC
ncbi:sulfurtransferase [Rahnella victoriana]|uniref:Sulfurtransferase n=1 Tax=Rahnella victoriana TaxID=1510570 RepID=A0ABS0DP09_9GAMM|nr:rhodanese-like domain-containing protein [Rahnella victoriana]MBF7955624.1 sulfurtransferase [Rahnella victoriana]UHM90323.1 sulfurtransferase [Rahnella victoriana]